jgi:hypothetical protein
MKTQIITLLAAAAFLSCATKPARALIDPLRHCVDLPLMRVEILTLCRKAKSTKVRDFSTYCYLMSFEIPVTN